MLKNFKQNLTLKNPELTKIKSSHLTEAIAKSFGYKTNASLIASDPIITEDCFWNRFNIEVFFDYLKEYDLDIEKSNIISVVKYYKDNSLPIFSDRDDFKKTLKNLKEKYHLVDKKCFHLPDIYTLILFKEMSNSFKYGNTFLDTLRNIMNNVLYTKDFDEKTRKKINEVQKDVLNRLYNGENYLSAINEYISPYMTFLFLPLDYGLIDYGLNCRNEYLDIITKQFHLDENPELNFIKMIETQPLWNKDFNFILSCHFFKSIMNAGNSVSTLPIEKYFLSFTKNDNLLLHILIDATIHVNPGKDIKHIFNQYACKMNIPTYELINIINNFWL